MSWRCPYCNQIATLLDSNKSDDVSCSDAGTIAVSIVAGPLNYMGANPKVKCAVPQPSK